MTEIEKLYEKLNRIKGTDPISRARRQAIINKILALLAEE